MTTTAPTHHHGRRLGTVPEYDSRGNPARALVVATLRIAPAQNPEHHQTVEHEPLPADAVNVSLTGTITVGRDDAGGGQIVDTLRDPDFHPVDGVTTAEVARIAELWDRWHLNEMRAACAHMPGYDEIAGMVPEDYPQRYGRADVTGWAIKNVECSAGTGYTYGHAWLYEPIPPEVLDELRALFPDPLTTRGYDLAGKPTE